MLENFKNQQDSIQISAVFSIQMLFVSTDLKNKNTA